MQSKQNHSSEPLIKRLERVSRLVWEMHIEEQIQAGIEAAMQSKKEGIQSKEDK